MQDYRLDEIENPQRHPAAVDRLTGRRPRHRIDRSGGETARAQSRWPTLRSSMAPMLRELAKRARSQVLVHYRTAWSPGRDG